MSAAFWVNNAGIGMPLIWLAGAGLILLLGAVWSCWGGRGGLWKVWCVLLRAGGIAALLFCLLDLQRMESRARPGANLLAVVADNSMGMQVCDRGEQMSRGKLMQSLLDPENARWIGEVEGVFELRRFTFDSRLRSVRDFREMSFDGQASAIGAMLCDVSRRLSGRPVAGIVLFTDGISTDNAEELIRGVSLPPVYPVMIGRAGGVRDLAIKSAQASQTAFEDAPVTLRVEVTACGWRGEEVVARLSNDSGRPVMELAERARKDPETLVFNFRWRPEKAGLSFYHVQVGGRAQMDAAGSLGAVDESTLLNNARTVPVERGRGPYRVLYVGGRPNWEYKFLKRALEVDDQIQLVGLVRVAKREPKFEFIGRAGETGNPLFRGFGDQSREETERYDQPVLLRLDTRDEAELSSGFPRTPDDLYVYDALILDDIESGFFEAVQHGLIRSFVAERGGGLLMLGGIDSFAEGGWGKTVVNAVLPVYLDRLGSAKGIGPYRLGLTREGFLEPWARLRDNENDEEARRTEIPAFDVLNHVGEPKPGATLIARAVDAAGHEHPAIAVQRFGRGRAAAVMIGDFWRWGMRNAEARLDMEKSWRQLVRWLTSDVPRRIELVVEPQSGAAPGTVRIEARVRDGRFEPVDDASVTVEIRAVSARAMSRTNEAAEVGPIRVRAEASDHESGLYTAGFAVRDSGAYHGTAYVTNSAGAEIGRAETGWSIDLAADELRSLQPDARLLAAIARQTGGEVVRPEQLGALAKRLPAMRAPVMESVAKSAWHTAWLFLFALGCFVVEWWLRRTRGLP